MAATIALTSDYGTRDEFVASMKGVILDLCPSATLVDVTHEIAAHAVDEGAWLLASVFRSFPKGTIHVAVVDPGVGSSRRAIAAQSRHAYWVGPDNGLFTLVLDRDQPVRVVEINQQRFYRPLPSALPLRVTRRFGSSTFDGRDLFAPVAARLACGSPLGAFGSPIDDWVRLPIPEPRMIHATPQGKRGRQAGKTRRGRTGAANAWLEGMVVRIDRFGNLMTNITADQLGSFWPSGATGTLAVTIGRRRLHFYHYYAEVDQGALGALVNSAGYLEIFASRASAKELTGLGKQATVRIGPA